MTRIEVSSMIRLSKASKKDSWRICSRQHPREMKTNFWMSLQLHHTVFENHQKCLILNRIGFVIFSEKVAYLFVDKQTMRKLTMRK